MNNKEENPTRWEAGQGNSGGEVLLKHNTTAEHKKVLAIKTAIKTAIKRRIRHNEQYKNRLPHLGHGITRQDTGLIILRKLLNGGYKNEPTDMLERLAHRMCEASERANTMEEFFCGVRIQKTRADIISINVIDFNRIFKGLKRLKRRLETTTKRSYYFSEVA